MSTRLRSRLIWHDAKVLKEAQLLATPSALRETTPSAGPLRERPDFETPIAPRERAVSLLHVGSEIEHALMVQYLYAAYSLNENQATEQRRLLVKKWKSAILEIAREEMGHLTTVQNILTLIGGALCFEREDYPIIDKELWPFPFELEALTKNSLGKYVLAEMPSEEVLEKLNLTKEIDEIKHRLKVEDGIAVHRVGLIYEEILLLFTAAPPVQGPIVPNVTEPHPTVATVDIQADSLPFQANPNAWGLGYKEILVEVASDRPSALAALQKVSVQGEGPLGTNDGDVQKEFEQSHFRRFLDIYREFPEHAEWSPARPVATNPTTNPQACNRDRLIEGEATQWAELANLRYRMLLLYLKHSFCIESPDGSQQRSPRGALISWAFGEMYNLRTLAEVLMNMPLKPQSAQMAGPPFDMPYTLALATRNADRWRAHRDLLMASMALIDLMLTRQQVHETYLRALRAADQTALDQVIALIGA